MTRPSRIQQPGPEQFPRIIAQEGWGRAFEMTLKAGDLLLEAVRAGFAEEGFASGTLNIGALALGPFAYVMPALSTDGKNAAFYSETFRPAGTTRLEGGAMTFGLRAGAPFFHTHALWVEASGRLSGGHILPEETIVAEAGVVTAFGLEGARFESRFDPEINFTVFGPEPAPHGRATTDTRAMALRLRPNQCLHGALEAVVGAAGWCAARVLGGVGSTIGAAFEDGRVVEPFATEVYIRAGTIAPGAEGQMMATLDAALIDYTGQIAQGRLLRGANPALMTFELIIAEA